MKHLPNIAGGLLGFAFVASSVMFFKMYPNLPPPPPESHVEKFMGAFAPTGYMHFVKVVELLGGIMVAIPFTRNIGLLFLGPVILNIIAFHALVAKDLAEKGTFITLAVLGGLAAYLLWAGRARFAGLLNTTSKP